MKRFHVLFLALLATASVLMTSCGDDEELTISITGMNITAPEVTIGIVDEATKTITFNVPFGTDLTNVTGTFVTNPAGGTITPDISAGVDFSGGSVTFTVSHPDDGGVTATYTVNAVVGENPLRIVMVGDGAFDNLHTEMQTAYNWCLDTYGNKAKYVSFQDLANEDLSTTKVIWWHEYDTANGGRVINSAAAAATSTVNTFYQGGGHLLLTIHASSYLVELGRIGADWAPTGGGYGNNDGNLNPDNWGWSFAHPVFTNSYPADNADHPVWANTTKATADFEGVQYDFVPGIDGGTKRDAGYFWDFNWVIGNINHFDTDGNGAIDAAEKDTDGDGDFDADDNVQQVKEYFETQTSSTVLGSFEWDPAANGVELGTCVQFNANGSYSGMSIVISAGAYEWYQNDGRSNAWRGNQEAMTAGAFTHFGVQ